MRKPKTAGASELTMGQGRYVEALKQEIAALRAELAEAQRLIIQLEHELARYRDQPPDRAESALR